MNFANNAREFDVVNDIYTGFMAYVKNKCGGDFINAWFDGRISYQIRDYGDYYTPLYMFNRRDGKHSSVMIQFFRIGS